MNKQDLIAFETRIKDHWEAGRLPSLVHLCGGNEDQLLEIFDDILPCDWVFSTHRNHYHALLKGIPPTELEEKIMRGRSMFIYDADRHFFCSAILAGTAAIAAGVAWTLKEEGSSAKVVCFIGDGGEAEGHFYEAAQFVMYNDLPCRFIIEDNSRSVTTPTHNHGGLDQLYGCVERYRYAPTYPHAGSGCKHHIEFDKEAVRRGLERSQRPPSAFSGQNSIPGADAFGTAVHKPYAGDCLDGMKEYRKLWGTNQKQQS